MSFLFVQGVFPDNFVQYMPVLLEFGQILQFVLAFARFRRRPFQAILLLLSQLSFVQPLCEGCLPCFL